MESIGNEVGQKMRSAIKAKLMELGSYVDDELPDYIMVMVANKRTKSQMESDLQLFLRENTQVFVEWLQQVLKKLKEVRLSNPEVYNELKRKTTIEMAQVVVKKERNKRIKLEKMESKSRLLSDNIPVVATNLVGNKNMATRTSESSENNDTLTNVNEDSFDIPSISEVNLLEDSELEAVADKIKKAKMALLKSDSEDEEFININADTEELLGNELTDTSSTKLENVPKSRQIINLKRQRIFAINSKAKIDNERAKEKVTDLRESLNNRNTSTKSTESKTTSSNNTQQQKKTISLSERLREEKEISGKIFGNAISKITHKKDDNQKEEKVNKEKKKSVHSRLGAATGIPSMVSVPKKALSPTRERNTRPNRSIPSMVKVNKPKKPTGFCQANKNLLLKAVAEAQRSVTQVPTKAKKDLVEESKSEPKKNPIEENLKNSRIMKTVTKNKPALFTKKYKETIQKRKLDTTSTNEDQSDSETLTKKSKNIIIKVQNKSTKPVEANIEENSNDSEYIPKSIKKIDKNVENDYVPSNIDMENEDIEEYLEEMDNYNDNSRQSTEDNDEPISKKPTTHQFIVTLDGIKDKLPFKKDESLSPTSTTNIGDSPKSKKPPSPIIFDKKPEPIPVKPTRNVPDTLPKVVLPKERCKYWPTCRLGDKCEFSHPSSACKVFPNCKFGDRCIYVHPKCKFFSSCTRKDCPYSHVSKPVIMSKPAVKSHYTYHPTYHSTTQEVCKYFPNCNNTKCTFYHPKPCKFGVACLNKSECGYSHSMIPTKDKLTWHSVK